MSLVELRHQRKRALEQYAYWSARARKSAEKVGRDSEVYRADSSCAMRLREERDNLRVVLGRVRRANTFMEIPWHEIEALDV